MNILFVCKYNRFRSKVAEAFFNHYNKNKKIKVKSAGMQIDFLRTYIAKNVLDVMKNKGIEIEDEKSRAIDEHLIKWADEIIIVANNVPPEEFKEKEIEVWLVEDTSEEDIGMIKKSTEQVEKNIKKLINRLNYIGLKPLRV